MCRTKSSGGRTDPLDRSGRAPESLDSITTTGMAAARPDGGPTHARKAAEVTSPATTPSASRQLCSELRVLSVRQPWAWQIVHEDKDVENRLLPTTYRGQVAIFAPFSPDVTALQRLPRVAPAWVDAPRQFELGAIIGLAQLVDCHDASWCGEDQYGRAIQMCSPWSLRSHQHLVLSDPVALRNPVSVRNRRGLWKVGARLMKEIEAQLP